MHPDDEQLRRREVERSIQAKAITESPLWDEAYQMLIDAELARMLARSTDDMTSLECKRRILALQDLKSRFGEVMQTGRLAEMQLEQERSENG